MNKQRQQQKTTERQQKNKQTNETNIKKEKKRYPPNPTRFSERFFTCSLPVSILKFY